MSAAIRASVKSQFRGGACNFLCDSFSSEKEQITVSDDIKFEISV